MEKEQHLKGAVPREKEKNFHNQSDSILTRGASCKQGNSSYWQLRVVFFFFTTKPRPKLLLLSTQRTMIGAVILQLPKKNGFQDRQRDFGVENLGFYVLVFRF